MSKQWQFKELNMPNMFFISVSPIFLHFKLYQAENLSKTKYLNNRFCAERKIKQLRNMNLKSTRNWVLAFFELYSTSTLFHYISFYFKQYLP